MFNSKVRKAVLLILLPYAIVGGIIGFLIAPPLLAPVLFPKSKDTSVPNLFLYGACAILAYALAKPARRAWNKLYKDTEEGAVLDRFCFPAIGVLIAIFAILWWLFPALNVVFLSIILALITVIIAYYVQRQNDLRELTRKITNETMDDLKESGYLVPDETGAHEETLQIVRSAVFKATLRVLRER